MWRKTNTETPEEREERQIVIPLENDELLVIPVDELPEEKQKALDFFEMRRMEITELAKNLRLGVISVARYDEEMRIIVNSIEKEALAWE